MSFEVLSVDHVTVTAPQELEGEVVEWYRGCLRLEELSKPEGAQPAGAWFRVGDQELHVSVHPRNPHQAAHFGIVVDDFNRAVNSLRAAGCHIEQAPPIPGRRRFFTRDPAGNSVEIIAVARDEDATVNYEES